MNIVVRNRLTWVVVAITLLLSIPVLAQSLTIAAKNNWKGIFADKAAPFELLLTGKRNSVVVVVWKLSLKGRRISSGQQTVRFKSSDSVTAILSLQIPPMKPGINLDAKLSIEVADQTDLGQKVYHQTRLTLVGPDLLLSKRLFFQQLNIQLFDPLGQTAKLLDDLKIDYVTRSKNQLMDLTDQGLILVGTGVALDRQSGLIDSLITLASNGHRVLIFQPVSGGFPMSALTAGSTVLPSTMSFEDNSIVQSFSGDLDWYPAIAQTHGISLFSARQSVQVKISANNNNNNNSWEWFQIGFDRSGGQLIISMLPFFEYDNSPVPQLIFSRLLAYANGQLNDLHMNINREK